MKYLLRLPNQCATSEVEIDEAEFSALREARNVLSNCLAIEEKYEILLSNYFELEQQILQATASHMIRGFPKSYVDFRLVTDLDFQLMIDLRLVNLLTSVRLYLDQLPGHVRDCLPHQSDIVSTVKSTCAAEYDSRLEFRFMEALRNHVQHRGLAVHELSIFKGWTEVGGERLIEYSLGFRSLKTRLASEGKFKKQVLDEIPDKVDLKLATRCYIESLCDIHNEIRKMIAESVDCSREKVEDAFCQYNEIHGEDVEWLEVCKTDGGYIVENEPLFLVEDDIRKQLQDRNGSLTNLHKRFATNK